MLLLIFTSALLHIYLMLARTLLNNVLKARLIGPDTTR